MVSLCCSPRKVSHTRGSHVELTNTRARRAHLLIVALKSIFYIYIFFFSVCVFNRFPALLALLYMCMCMRIRIRISFVEDDVSFKLVLAFAVCVSASSSSSLNSSTCANETGNSN